MPLIRRSITIAAPPERVWSVLIDMPRQPEWMRDLRAVTLDEPGPVRVGTRATAVVRMFGVSQADPIVVTELDPPRRYALRHVGRWTGTGTFELEPLRERTATRVRWTEELRLDPSDIGLPGPLRRVPGLDRLVRKAAGIAARLADPLLAPVFHHVFRADLRRLRRLVVAGANDHGTDPREATSGAP